MQPKPYQYRATVGGSIIESATPYQEKIHDIAIVSGDASAKRAEDICRQIGMVFISGAVKDGLFQFKAQCTEETSSFFWAGGKDLQ